jgi:hypothetical protein
MMSKKLLKYAPVLALSMFATTANAATVVNEDFEGDLSAWFEFPNGGTISLVADNGPSAGGSQAVSLYADTTVASPAFPILKIERVGGNLSGLPVTVQFDARAPIQTVDSTVGDQVGKVVFIAELFSEFASDGATNEILFAPPTFLDEGWNTYTFNTTLGPDAAGGLSLLFKADCGAAANCALDAVIDNVSVSAVPVPAAVWLFGSGLLGLVGVARRRKGKI